MEWKKEYISVLKETLEETNFHFDNNKINEIAEVISKNESYLKSFSKQILLDYINSNCNTNLDMNFMDKLVVNQGNCYEKDDRLEELLKYLSNKYDLLIISNWFTYTQKKRLENMGIIKYFKLIIGADENYFKPDKRMYNIIKDKYDFKDIISVGDDYNLDILPAKEVGMDVIWVTDKKDDNIKTIKNIYELRDIL